MIEENRPSLAELIERARSGDSKARDGLFLAVHGELRAMARRQMQRQPTEHTLQPTALVNEVYLRVFDKEWKDKQHFLAVAAKAMRSILVDHARRKSRAGRVAGGLVEPGLDALAETYGQRSGDLLALDVALERLAKFDPHLERLVELRFFVGLSMEAVAQLMGISPRSAQRQWATARAWLAKELG